MVLGVVEVLALRSCRNTWNNNFSSCNWKNHKLQILLLRWLIFMLVMLHASQFKRADWWASTLSLGVLLSTGSEQNQLSANYQKEKKGEKKRHIFFTALLHSEKGGKLKMGCWGWEYVWDPVGNFLLVSQLFVHELLVSRIHTALGSLPLVLVAVFKHRWFSIGHRNRI